MQYSTNKMESDFGLGCDQQCETGTIDISAFRGQRDWLLKRWSQANRKPSRHRIALTTMTYRMPLLRPRPVEAFLSDVLSSNETLARQWDP